MQHAPPTAPYGVAPRSLLRFRSMGLVIDTPWNREPWTRVDSAGQPIEPSDTLDDLERDLAERAEAREMAKSLSRRTEPPRSTVVMEPTQPGAVELSAGSDQTASEHERACEMVKRLRRQVGKLDGRTELAEPQQRVVELAGAGAATSSTGSGAQSTSSSGGSWDESKHPRNAKGSSSGGKFAKKDSGGGGQEADFLGWGGGSKASKAADKRKAAAATKEKEKKKAADQKRGAAAAKRVAHAKVPKAVKGRRKGKALTALSHAERHQLLVKLDAKLKAQGVSPRQRLKVVKAAAHRLELAAMKPHDRIAARELDRAQATAARDKQQASKAVARQQAAAQHAAARQAAKALAMHGRG